SKGVGDSHKEFGSLITQQVDAIVLNRKTRITQQQFTKMGAVCVLNSSESGSVNCAIKLAYFTEYRHVVVTSQGNLFYIFMQFIDGIDIFREVGANVPV